MLATTATVTRVAVAPARGRSPIFRRGMSAAFAARNDGPSQRTSSWLGSDAKASSAPRATTKFHRTEFHSSSNTAASAPITAGGPPGGRHRTNDNTELERCVALDARRMSRASLFGLSAVPIAVAIDSAAFTLFEAEIQSSMIVETGSMIFAMHMGWSISWFLCLRTLHMRGDPLTDLAERWSMRYQAQLFDDGSAGAASAGGVGTGSGDERRGEDDSPRTAASSPAPVTNRFIGPEEWYEARRLNLERVRDSYNAGLYGPVSLVFAIAPFVSFTEDWGTAEDYEWGDTYHFPSTVWPDNEPGNVPPGAEGTMTDIGMDGSAMYQPSLLDSVLEGNPNIYDLGMLALCAAGTFLAGRKAYRSWIAVQANPPTDLPLRVSLRAAAVASESTDVRTRAAADAAAARRGVS